MKEIVSDFVDLFAHFRWLDLAFILVLAVFYYRLFAFLKRNNAKSLIWLYALATVFFGAAIALSGIPGEWLLLVPAVMLLATASVFAIEIKRDVWNGVSFIRRSEGKKSVDARRDTVKVERCITEIIKALQNMSKNNVGAIVVLAYGNVPDQIVESGVSLNGEISSQLIESVFFPKTPLHDGAMIIEGDRIVAAGCFLPLSQEHDLPKELGTRHRAGIGVTENINVTALIVSEETGIISIAREGKIRRYADTEMLKKELKRFYWQDFAA